MSNEKTNSLDKLLNKKITVPKDRNAPVVIYEDILRGGKDPIRYGKLMSINFPPDEWIIDGLIPKGLTIMSAQPASYKTWLLLDMVLAISQGELFLDHFQTTKNGVLIVDEENSAPLLQKRLKMLGKSDELNIHFFIEQGFKLSDDVVNQIIKVCQKENLSFVTFDSLVRIHDKNENDAVQMAEVFRQVRKLTHEGISVLITHHNRKTSAGDDNGAQSMRGSSDILASVDCHLSLKRIAGSKLLSLTQTKVRNTAEIDPFDIDIDYDDESMTFTYISPQATTILMRTDTSESVLAILADEQNINQKQIASLLDEQNKSVNIKALRSVLNSLVTKKEIVANRGKGKEILYSLPLIESS